MEISIDGSALRVEADFYVALSRQLGFPSSYVRNSDALWDAMTTDVERPLTLVWRNSAASERALAGNFTKLVEILRKVEAQDREWGLVDRFALVLL